MSGKLPVVKSKEVLRVLERAGFVVIRTRGSHYMLEHPDDPSRRTTVPMHNKDLPPGTLRAILKQVGLSVDEFRELL